MAIEGIGLNLESLDGLPESIAPADLFREVDGKYVLDVPGIKSEADVTRLQEGIRKEREATRKAKEALTAWRALGDDPEEIQSSLDQIEELRAIAEKGDGKDDEDRLAKRLQAKLAPYEREKAKAQKAIEERDALISQYQAGERSRKREAVFSKLADDKKIIADYRDDWLSRASLFDETEDGDLLTKDGIDPATMLEELVLRKPAWLGRTSGGGAAGSGGAGGGGPRGSDNPWTKSGWNITKQGAYKREHGKEAAERAARAAGSSIDALRPPEK